MKNIFDNDWQDLLKEEMEKPYYKNLRELLIEEYRQYKVFPIMENIFNAFAHTPYAEVKIVILGQDPYHGVNQAHGMAFSVQEGIKNPPSLKNIFKELKSDLNVEMESGDLTHWADQGVLLLNTTLTVREASPMSHSKIGWEIFTDRVIELLNKRQKPLVFILWGAHARSKGKLIDSRHLVLESVHPSPLSANRGFFGSKPFSKANEFLRSIGETEIIWDRRGRNG